MSQKPNRHGGSPTRRQFLCRSATTAAGVVLGIPSFLPGTAFGWGRAAPSERVTLGFIGLGWKGFEGCWGSLLQTFIADLSCQVLAVCDVDRRYLERAKSFVDQTYGNQDCATCHDFRDLLARPELDAVVIATPDHWHAVQTIWACRAGKDVFCEKPLSLTIREARAMVDAARRYNRIVQTGSQSRSNGRVSFGCEVVRQGRIGQVREVHVTCGPPSVPCDLPAEPVPDYLDWDLWLGPAPWRPYHARIHPVQFRAWFDYSGGGMTDWGAHHFDIAQWGLGMDHTGPVEILPPDGQDQKQLTLKYANGVTVRHTGYDVSQGVTFFGSEGRVNLMAVSGRATFEPEELGRQCRDLETQASDLLANKGHYANFLDCVRSRKRPAADVEIGCRTVTVCHLANIAHALKRPLRWDPVKEEFPNDAEANRCLARANREPWQI
ncbi:MAG: Gfo/Idh/MocA family oxidoreductase [Pirellulaceae bacterium]|jgi:predicted dehydrogenase|nr:Gfo/Idh/MocA family oxidoreductase [Pirellulaceae bacterium]